VHVKDRGNVALPIDIVKVLKTQDENYIRTMRLANLKVYSMVSLLNVRSVDMQVPRKSTNSRVK